MIFFIIAIIALVVGIIGAIISDEYKGAIISVCLVVAIVLGVLSCMTSVPAGHTGVVTTFGKVENYTLDSGMHFVKPWQHVIKMDNRVQKQTVLLSCFSSDIQEVSMAYTINYQISKADAMTIYSTVGTKYYDTVIAPNIAEAVKVATARYTAEDLIGMRDGLAVEIEEVLAKKLVQYNIEVVSTSIEDMDFTDVFTNAVEAKQVAAQDKLRAETEQAQKTMEAEETAKRAVIAANAEAEQSIIAANAELEVVKVQAEAALYAGEKEAEMNKRISESLTDGLIDYYRIKQWDGQLPKITSGGSTIVNTSDFFGRIADVAENVALDIMAVLIIVYLAIIVNICRLFGVNIELD